MDEILSLLRENNIMLRYICRCVSKADSKEKEDIKGLMSNLVAGLYTGRVLNAT